VVLVGSVYSTPGLQGPQSHRILDGEDWRGDQIFAARARLRNHMGRLTRLSFGREIFVLVMGQNFCMRGLCGFGASHGHIYRMASAQKRNLL